MLSYCRTSPEMKAALTQPGGVSYLTFGTANDTNGGTLIPRGVCLLQAFNLSFTGGRCVARACRGGAGGAWVQPLFHQRHVRAQSRMRHA